MSNNSICEEITQWSHLHVGFHTPSVFNKTLHIPRSIDKLLTLAFDTCWIRRVRSNEVLSSYEHPRLYNKRNPRLTLIYKTTHGVILVRPTIFILNFARTDCLAIACVIVSFNLFSSYISKWTALNYQASSQEVWEWSVQQHSLSQENLEHLCPTLRLIGSYARHWTCVLVGETQLRTLSTYSRTHLPLTAFIDSGCRYAQITTVFLIQDIMLT